MHRPRLSGCLVLAIVAIPLNDGRGWRDLSYKNITPNTVTFADDGLTIAVRESSSPLLYPFTERKSITSLAVKGSVSGLPKGGDDADDYAFRAGLILEGETGLSWLEKLFAPQWLRQLIDLAPEGTRFGKVAFLAIAQTKPVGTRWPHPKSKYVELEAATQLREPGPFAWDHAYPEPQPALGLWLHADGDDTRSSFDVHLTKLAVGIAETPRSPARVGP